VIIFDHEKIIEKDYNDSAIAKMIQEDILDKYSFSDEFQGGKVVCIGGKTSVTLIQLYEPYNELHRVVERDIIDSDIIVAFENASVEYKLKLLGL
jgi:hypothetical protein